jgi:hypothetical protein
MTHQQVAAKLAERGLSFGDECCYGPDYGWAIVVLIAQEDPPWFCSTWNIYVVLVFRDQKRRKEHPPMDSDSLVGTNLLRRGGACL